MAKQLKKASLLSEADKQKLLKKTSMKKPIQQSVSSISAAPTPVTQRVPRSTQAETNTETATGSKAKLVGVLILLMVLALLLLPKPQLLEYQSAGIVTQSIYLPGYLGKPATILDTNQRAVLAEEEQSLYLCFEGQSNEQCAKYQLRKQQGVIAAALFWFSSAP
jgi:hypothetical protein